jgi:hypothetical protein
MSHNYDLDLVVLVPGKDEKETINGLLSKRERSLNIRRIAFKIEVHPRHDPGCFLEAHEFLRPYIKQAAHALVLFDHEGSGQEEQSSSSVSADLMNRLAKCGWTNDRAQVIIIDPELEDWVWSGSSKIEEILGWKGRSLNVHQWLAEKGSWREGCAKPDHPKEALEEALREVKVPRSSSLYKQLAENVSLKSCQNSGFNRLKCILRTWFPSGGK